MYIRIHIYIRPTVLSLYSDEDIFTEFYEAEFITKIAHFG